MSLWLREVCPGPQPILECPPLTRHPWGPKFFGKVSRCQNTVLTSYFTCWKSGRRFYFCSARWHGPKSLNRITLTVVHLGMSQWPQGCCISRCTHSVTGPFPYLDRSLLDRPWTLIRSLLDRPCTWRKLFQEWEGATEDSCPGFIFSGPNAHMFENSSFCLVIQSRPSPGNQKSTVWERCPWLGFFTFCFTLTEIKESHIPCYFLLCVIFIWQCSFQNYISGIVIHMVWWQVGKPFITSKHNLCTSDWVSFVCMCVCTHVCVYACVCMWAIFS